VHLYLHIPFCRRICPYCGFYKHTPGNLANRAFVDAILAEARVRIEQQGDLLSSPFHTVFFGGGTPSLLSPAHLRRLCEGLREIVDLDAVEEWTLEANPATFTLEKARLMRELGIDRVSLGVQSFQPALLGTLGRDHSPEEAVAAFRMLRDAGFENLSLDLIFSVPGQDLSLWQADLEAALALEPEHLSAYNLTYEEDTEFLRRHARGELDSDEDRDASLFRLAMDLLESRGYEHYEISNYARPGRESLHNRAYWSGADYLGLGPGAVSTLGRHRWKTLPDTAAYVRAVLDGGEVRTEAETLDDAALRLERLALQLRTREGIPRELVPPEDAPGLARLVEAGWLEERGARLALTREGRALADSIATELS